MENLTRREREKLLRKQEIMKVSARLFAEKGFASTTLEEIATKAEYGTGTIYNYFQNKDEIIKCIIESVFEANIALIQKAEEKAENLLDFFKVYIRSIFDYFIENKEEILLMARYFVVTPKEEHNTQLQSCHCRLDDMLYDRITRGIKDGDIREVNAEKLFYYTHSMIYPYITILIHNNKFSADTIHEHADFLIDLFFNGIKKNSNEETK